MQIHQRQIICVGNWTRRSPRGQHTQGFTYTLSEVCLWSSHLTASEYQMLCIWLEQAPAPPAIYVVSTRETANGTSPMPFPHHRSASERSKGSMPPASRVTFLELGSHI
jgi:hypothetical protein